MRVFLTGANGWIGSIVSRDLIAAGHTVTGLVRSREKGETLAVAGAKPVIGSIGDVAILRRCSDDAEGVVHTAFGLDLTQIGRLADEDRRAIETFGEVFKGSKRPIVVTSGFLHPSGAKASEEDRPEILPDFPRASEQTAFGLAMAGIHANVIRNPRSVHGPGETHGFVPMLAAVARDKGVSAYVGDGQNLWPSVHRLDCARVYRLALERGGIGEAFHAVAEEGIPFKAIAEAIGRQVGVAARSLTEEKAGEHFGPLAVWVSGDGPASSRWTRETLSWQPREAGMVEDIERSDYSG